MKTKNKVIVGGIVTFIFMYIERRKLKVRKLSVPVKPVNSIPDIERENKVKDIPVKEDHKKCEETMMTQMEIDELTRRVKAMSRDELEIVIDNVPVELCMRRIEKELEKAEAFENRVKLAAGLL